MIPLLATLALFALAALLYAFFVEPRRLRLIRPKLSTDLTRGAYAGRRVVFFSDLHLGRGMSPARLGRLVDRINDIAPDLILFGGDLTERSRRLRDPAYRAQAVALLGRLRAPDGCFAVLGNHDLETCAVAALARRMLADAGFTLLQNEWADCAPLPLYGFRDALYDLPRYHPTPAADRDDFKLILAHESDFALIKKPPVGRALICSGHSHGGQITLFGLPLVRTRMGRTHLAGPYRLGPHTVQWVSRGVGTVHLHARFCAPPDLLILDFPAQS